MTNWIATHTQYSLNPPRLGAGEDAVEQFLFEDQRGFCEQIATSLVVMLRSVGIPARLTAGYAAGRRNPFSGLYEVRASDAHAYAEVLFPGVGWQAFDPTADVPLAGESGAFPSRRRRGAGEVGKRAVADDAASDHRRNCGRGTVGGRLRRRRSAAPTTTQLARGSVGAACNGTPASLSNRTSRCPRGWPAFLRMIKRATGPSSARSSTKRGQTPRLTPSVAG